MGYSALICDNCCIHSAFCFIPSSGTLVNRGQRLLWSFWELLKRLKAVLQRSQFLCWSSTGKWMWYVILKAAECYTRMQAAQTKHCMYTQRCGISWLVNPLRGLRKCLVTCLSGWMHVFHLKVMQSLDEVLESKLVQHISNITKWPVENHHLVPLWSKSIHHHDRSPYIKFMKGAYIVYTYVVTQSTLLWSCHQPDVAADEFVHCKAYM